MAKRPNAALFREWSPRMMRDLMAAFPTWGPEDAAACVGNGGHESGGFKLMQELKPVVPGSRGGLGAFQWTGPRRKNFEAWCLSKGLHPHSYEASAGFLIHELKGPEKAAIAKTAKAKTLDAKVVAFELAFERAGVKHYPSRKQWARLALASFGDAPSPASPASSPSRITDRKTVQLQQEALTRLGYPTGGADGIIGPLTRGAIRDFRAENGLPPGDWIDDEMIAAVQKADRRKLAPERENASTKDVVERVPEAARADEAKRQSWLAKVGAAVTAAGSALWAFIDGVVSRLTDASGWLAPIKEFVGDIPPWGWAAIVAVGAAGLYLFASRAERAAVAAVEESADAYRIARRT